ncbi:MAG: DUF167 domain-containing protein [Planctomycetes bacterium]|nr:DUF167 domain-containing protein [Planctomycetota bacterium]
MTLTVHERDGALRFAVKVVPGAARDRIVGLYGDALKVQVAAPPEGGKANSRLCELLATALDVATRDVTVDSGHGSPRKVVAVRGLAAGVLRTKLGV